MASEDISEIFLEEIRTALRMMKNDNFPREDNVTVEMLKFGGHKIEKTLQTLLNKCLQDGSLWYNAKVGFVQEEGEYKSKKLPKLNF